MKAAIRTLTTLLLVLGGTLAARADATYDTAASWDGTSAIGGWGTLGGMATPTYGQTFVAPTADTVLHGFTFYLAGAAPGASLTFQADLYAWSGSLQAGHAPQGATGAPLFTSGPLTITDSGGFQAVTIDTGGVALTAGGAYVALLTTSDPASLAADGSSPATFRWGLVAGHPSGDGGGGLHFDQNPTSAGLGSLPWDDLVDFGDLAWTAHFSTSIPEPSSLVLLAAAGAMLTFHRIRRRPVHLP